MEIEKEIDKGGRPTDYRSEYDIQAYKLCLLGATDAEIGDFFGVTEQTINNWKNAHDGFFESIRAGKRIADMEVANSLYERSKGYDYVEQQAHKVRNSTGRGTYEEKVQVVEVSKHVPADPNCIKLWLSNREPKKWRVKQEHDHTTNGESLNKVKDLSLLSEEELRQMAAIEKKLNA